MGVCMYVFVLGSFLLLMYEGKINGLGSKNDNIFVFVLCFVMEFCELL